MMTLIFSLILAYQPHQIDWVNNLIKNPQINIYDQVIFNIDLDNEEQLQLIRAVGVELELITINDDYLYMWSDEDKRIKLLGILKERLSNLKDAPFKEEAGYLPNIKTSYDNYWLNIKIYDNVESYIKNNIDKQKEGNQALENIKFYKDAWFNIYYIRDNSSYNKRIMLKELCQKFNVKHVNEIYLTSFPSDCFDDPWRWIGGK